MRYLTLPLCALAGLGWGTFKADITSSLVGTLATCGLIILVCEING